MTASAGGRTVRAMAFGTYDADAHPRVRVLIEGLRAHGVEVREVNQPLGLSTAERVRLLRQPWRLPLLLLRLASRWSALARASRRQLRHWRPNLVLVGYLGHFDVVLARALFRRTTIVLDHLVFAATTAQDRGKGTPVRLRLLRALDGLALRCADLIVVDTVEHRDQVPSGLRDRCVVVAVGADDRWFVRVRTDSGARGSASPMSIVFFGLFTPLQGAPVIAAALRELHDRRVPFRATLIGSGQDKAVVREVLQSLPEITWRDWVDPAELPVVVAGHDVCLGIFGTTPKALKVVPNKVFQGAAAGCAVVTSDTPPQRRTFGDAAALVPPGDAAALADSLQELALSHELVDALRQRSRAVAEDRFSPASVVSPLVGRIRAVADA